MTRLESPAARHNITLGQLRSALSGAETTLSDSITVRGRVTATDIAGNFYKEMLIDDGTGAMSVLAGGFGLHNIYPPGTMIYIHLCGLSVATRQGVLVCGLPAAPGSLYNPDYMHHRAVCDKYIVRTADTASVHPAKSVIGSLSAEMCGRLVRIDSLRYCDTEPHWYDSQYTSQAERKFKDRHGDSIYVITSRYALFAGLRIPAAASLTGVLYTDGKTFKLKLRDETDIDLY